MPRARPRTRHTIDWKEIQPKELDESTCEVLIEAAGIDTIDEDGRRRAAGLVAEVEALLGIYPHLRKRHDEGPRPANVRVEVEKASRQALALLKTLEGLSEDAAMLLVGDPKDPKVDLRETKLRLLRLVNVTNFVRSYRKESRGQTRELAKRMIVFSLCRLFQRLRTLPEEFEEAGKKEFVEVALAAGGISFRRADLARLLKKFPLDRDAWPLDV